MMKHKKLQWNSKDKEWTQPGRLSSGKDQSIQKREMNSLEKQEWSIKEKILEYDGQVYQIPVHFKNKLPNNFYSISRVCAGYITTW